MEITNLNLLSIFIFIVIVLTCIFLLFNFYIKREKLKKKYILLFNQNKYFYVKYLLLFISLFFLLFSIFWIQYFSSEQEQKIDWIDLVFTLDVSKSMNALDFENSTISRLEVSKALITKYVLNNPNNRYWLVIFAWDAISLSPLTTDTSIFINFLQNVDYRNLSKQWTDLEKAINLSVDRLYFEKDDRSKALVLISDGWDEWEEINLDNIKKISKSKNIPNIILWVATNNWAYIPDWADLFWNIIYQKYNWEAVITKLNSSVLKDIANSLNWSYYSVSSISNLWKDLEKFDDLKKKSILTTGLSKSKDIWYFLSILSLLFFLLYLFFNVTSTWKKY